jgi:hypothetical protein
MRGMRWILVAMLVRVVSANGGAVAGDAASQPSIMSPLEVLADAIQAVESGDFERYVNHLTAGEQRLQAGYVLYIVMALTESKGGDAARPETILLTQALRDVAIGHLAASGQPGAAPSETPEMLVRKLLTSLFVQPVGPTAAGTPHNTPSFDQVCLKASALLDDPRDFLIDALQELSVATVVSGAEPDRPIESVDLAAQARVYQEVKRTLYTRGDRALAVPKLATSKPAPAAPTTTTPPPPSDNDPKPIHIEFRKIDTQWKIERLLPIAEMQSTINLAPNTTHAVPYPASW